MIAKRFTFFIVNTRITHPYTVDIIIDTKMSYLKAQLSDLAYYCCVYFRPATLECSP